MIHEREVAQGMLVFSFCFLWTRKMVDGKRKGRQVSQQVRVQCRVNSTNDLCAQRCPAHFASTTIARLLLPPWPRGADSRPGMDFQTAAVGGLWPSCEGACRAFARRIYSAARLDNRASVRLGRFVLPVSARILFLLLFEIFLYFSSYRILSQYRLV